MKYAKKFAELCTPAQIYFALSTLGVILALFANVPFVALALKFIFILLWTYILAALCKNGYAAISWFLVLLPFILMAFAMMGARSAAINQMMYQMKMY